MKTEQSFAKSVRV
ncbi:Protein of unknown function [Lactobacillus helveticus CIRM-BIA 951]|uniref:Uncharacterized protein n=2 Tax=Lactobacillus helveticus TaxID=1587 RepID=U4QNW8_LACHE|nr:Protein of unknown function [Lactobacillus helveticus CIRM-BIA 953]CDI58728.1 Protein of unknown function [Lactobacillus helveticus CIRM-BIA 951]CDI62355.1 Protein of unknown function [Lactobacillus helveticus CIRM-BIA 103]CDI41666.1 Protein of unknown function [Lactobacillus helveticus CIRM-BIA 953]CDI42578.1 Protein of unknown function [Lactobacillus helveticus CIRM-BIA 953]